MFLAYPICRYADEALMMDLTKRARSWRSSGAGDNAPPLATFRKANIYSNTRSAMLLADRYQELDHYAVIRNTDADTIRDRYLSDVGLDAQGAKIYDLGNQTVTVRLQNDLSFLVELPTGKTAKSLPKKNADAAKYAAANTDFSEMKKAVKKIVKNRVRTLFGDFLSGHGRTAAAWQEAYLRNVLLRPVASLLVWHQGTNTFIVTENGPVTVTGDAYTIADKPEIKVAHPMEMVPEEVTAWQKYFTAHGLKQPFEQIWEPVVDPATVTEDRYKDCMIPFYRFKGREKHGISIEDCDFHNQIDISFDGCNATVERIDWARHEIDMNHRFAVQSISFRALTRKVNHILAYLDRITVYDRIVKDDVTVAQFLPSFTLAQITEFIKLASENNCPNVTAILLDFQQKNFPNFDPLAEFTLD
jgi:hypothetical protein